MTSSLSCHVTLYCQVSLGTATPIGTASIPSPCPRAHLPCPCLAIHDHLPPSCPCLCAPCAAKYSCTFTLVMALPLPHTFLASSCPLPASCLHQRQGAAAWQLCLGWAVPWASTTPNGVGSPRDMPFGGGQPWAKHAHHVPGRGARHCTKPHPHSFQPSFQLFLTGLAPGEPLNQAPACRAVTSHRFCTLWGACWRGQGWARPQGMVASQLGVTPWVKSMPRSCYACCACMKRGSSDCPPSLLPCW